MSTRQDGKETKAMVQQTAKDATAIMQLMANNVTKVMSPHSCNHWHRPLLIYTDLSPYNRGSVATWPSNVVLISRSIHKSYYPVQRSTPRNRKLVLPGQSFQRVEVYWLPALDPQQAYVIWPTPVPLGLISLIYIAGPGKSILWCTSSHVFPFHVT